MCRGPGDLAVQSQSIVRPILLGTGASCFAGAVQRHENPRLRRSVANAGTRAKRGPVSEVKAQPAFSNVWGGYQKVKTLHIGDRRGGHDFSLPQNMVSQRAAYTIYGPGFRLGHTAYLALLCEWLLWGTVVTH